ncbi:MULTISPECIES: DUF732 domain-containing protein [unclassified Mycolicibacterium]|uniref:DUF732 domain-containing protein n=1 Tax=unclassified Mycolicibacterium TaxID=2636767 RepID=UPI0012DCD161|nr:MULTISPECIES: DUF732 domain-containing protein [unclassified Mycolicibacterium]MUL82996.1 DUF732 domain-containing protein [Mycolicibacterium sp. CBMA 329]MUL89331.1 DUF732 domain-containing protein [Mycolicibacterium sp. CBMA 331]MUL99020.1 DUF732 domain-containing protein [Mycolicibacterium sp. CBMA 334]MUM25682.1 DUF732 domain-containing protein [Mycolicibacterium sp. CBMA 295]MUM38847.1 DUF732 domain-containing protein [Mycolicibacterium sp. CBMA 247]
MTCPYCGSVLDAAGSCSRCGQVQASESTGWHPDPTARHEGRYFVNGHPTNRVRDGRASSTDQAGGRMLPDYLELPGPGIRSAWIGTSVAAAIIVMTAAVVWILLVAGRRTPPPPEAGYLSALRDAGLSDQFNSDANAVAHGRLVCRQLEDGQPQQGLLADKIAVDAFCPHFSQGFRVLEKTTVNGTFVLIDNAGVDGIASDGTTCQGANGYSDVNPGTPVTVKNGKGEVLATTTLGPGKSGAANCTFSFTVPVTEGQDRYVLSVGHRGEFSYSFEQLVAKGILMQLGH